MKWLEWPFCKLRENSLSSSSVWQAPTEACRGRWRGGEMLGLGGASTAPRQTPCRQVSWMRTSEIVWYKKVHTRCCESLSALKAITLITNSKTFASMPGSRHPTNQKQTLFLMRQRREGVHCCYPFFLFKDAWLYVIHVAVDRSGGSRHCSL